LTKDKPSYARRTAHNIDALCMGPDQQTSTKCKASLQY